MKIFIIDGHILIKCNIVVLCLEVDKLQHSCVVGFNKYSKDLHLKNINELI